MRQPKTKAELTALLMDALWRCPECSEITSVAIVAVDPKEPDLPNWDVAWVNGKKAHPPKAEEIARVLQREFILVE